MKAALTKAYNKGSKTRVIRTADLITLPGIKKAPKKRVQAMLEPVDVGDATVENEENNSDDVEDLGILIVFHIVFVYHLLKWFPFMSTIFL